MLLDTKKETVFLIGIGGVGMTPLALYLHEAGYRVIGSDLQDFRMRKVLQQKGIRVYLSQEKKHITSTISKVVYSTAIPTSNPERMEAKRLNIKAISRIQALQEISFNKQLISITGSYGKSTTTTFVSSMFEQAGLHPSWIIGADMFTYPCAKKDEGSYFVFETDESRPEFLNFSPTSLIVTNIGTDHLPNYRNSQAYLVGAINSIIQRTDEKVIIPTEMKKKYPTLFISGKTITCGFNEGDYTISNCQTYVCSDCIETTFSVKGMYSSFDAKISMPSERNVLDAVLSFALLESIYGEIDNPSSYFTSLPVMERRFQFIASDYPAYLIDDEGDSPEVIKEVLKDAKRFFPNRELVTVLQPHRYTRLQGLFTEYVEAMSISDTIVILPVYSAGEKKIKGVSSEALADGIKQRYNNDVFVTNSFQDTFERLQDFLQEDTVIVTLGPGNVWKLYEMVQ